MLPIDNSDDTVMIIISANVSAAKQKLSFSSVLVDAILHVLSRSLAAGSCDFFFT